MYRTSVVIHLPIQLLSCFSHLPPNVNLEAPSVDPTTVSSKHSSRNTDLNKWALIRRDLWTMPYTLSAVSTMSLNDLFHHKLQTLDNSLCFFGSTCLSSSLTSPSPRPRTFKAFCTVPLVGTPTMAISAGERSLIRLGGRPISHAAPSPWGVLSILHSPEVGWVPLLDERPFYVQ